MQETANLAAKADAARVADVARLPPPALFIGGQWVEPEGGRTFPTENPATEEVLCQVASASSADAGRAVEAAHAALAGDWGQKTSARDRGRLLYKIADALEARIDEFALAETLDNGKPIFESRYVDLPTAIDALRYFAGWADKITGDTLPVSGPFVLAYTLREPVGVVAAITPWNFPIIQAMWKISAALACGNTVVHKPASYTPLTALKFAELASEAGLPAGVLNVVPGGGAAVGNALVQDPRVAKITFTGSTEVGRDIMRGAADTIKRVTLELGGKSPNIVFADADLDAAVKGAYNGIFYGKGEVCAAGSRLFVEQGVHDEVVERLVERTRRLVPGDPLDPKTRLGALVSEKQRESVLGYVETGRREGARIAHGGEPATVGGKGWFMQPTVLDQVHNDMTVAREEIFGPVVVVIPFRDVKDAVAQANANIYGLAAGVWTRDVGKAHQVARQVQAGTVWINQYNWYDSGAPFGGYKQSGFGRELGKQALESYTETKSVYVGR
ncbi:MAG TPA: aldehyde dehydrogenase family protein [Thermoanaerobaculia bacterium]|nr:aldehyde dehydrogenase family protein [Thermoanaerobaculia bacterium]